MHFDSFYFWFSLQILFLFEHIMHGHIREWEEIPNFVHLNITILLCWSTQMLYMIGGLSLWDDYLYLSLRIFWLFPLKKVIWVLSIRNHLIVLITNTSHRAHLLSCALKCSSKVQEIQSLKNFVSMAVQGTQVPMYTNTHYFCIFLIFQKFFKFFMKNKIKQNWKQTNKNKLNKAKHKTRLTQNKKAKQTSNAQTKGER